MNDNRSLKQELKSWERNFREQNDGRAPTKDDMKKDATIGKQANEAHGYPFQIMKYPLLVPAAKYKLYRALTKASSATADSSASSQSGQQTRLSGSQSTQDDSALTANPSTPPSLRSFPKSRPVESPAKPTTCNPFSPVKQSQRVRRVGRHNSREATTDDDSDNALDGRCSKAEPNPFVVFPSTESTVHVPSIFAAHTHHLTSQSSVKSTSSPSSSLSPKVLSSKTLHREISPDETRSGGYPAQPMSRDSKRIHGFANSPRKVQDFLAASSMANGTAKVLNQMYTPRTKARKRMRGEDIPYTPSEGRRQKRWRESPPHHGDPGTDIPNGSRNSPTLHCDEEQTGGGGDIDELPESPVKPRYASSIGSRPGFKPIFDETSSTTRTFPPHPTAHDGTYPTKPAPILENANRWSAGSSSQPHSGEQSPVNVVMGTTAGVVGPEYALYPPSPPAHKQHSARSNSRVSRGGQAPDVSHDEVDEVERSASDHVVISHNLAWGTRADWLARQGVSDLDLDDDDFGKTVLPPRSQPPTPEIRPTVDNDLEISDNLRQALTISAFCAGHNIPNIPREPRVAAASHRFMQGREDLSLSRVESGIWDIGEVDVDDEDWESEPDGWNASRDS